MMIILPGVAVLLGVHYLWQWPAEILDPYIQTGVLQQQKHNIP